jgi:hypothetical protein
VGATGINHLINHLFSSNRNLERVEGSGINDSAATIEIQLALIVLIILSTLHQTMVYAALTLNILDSLCISFDVLCTLPQVLLMFTLSSNFSKLQTCFRFRDGNDFDLHYSELILWRKKSGVESGNEKIKLIVLVYGEFVPKNTN